MYLLLKPFYPFPQLVSLLITFLTSGEPSWHGYLYCSLLLLTTLTNTILSSQMVHIQVAHLLLSPSLLPPPQDRVGLRVQTALTAAIYSKTLRLSTVSRQATTGAHH